MDSTILGKIEKLQLGSQSFSTGASCRMLVRPDHYHYCIAICLPWARQTRAISKLCSDSLCRDGRVMVVNRHVQPQALTFFTE
jgi:hypothetical protein